MCEKRGQISLYIIIGLIIILVIGLFIILRGNSVEQNDYRDLTPEQRNLYALFTGCLDRIGQEVVYLIADNSGYIATYGDPDYLEVGDGRPFQNHYYTEKGNPVSYIYNGYEILLRPNKDIQDMMSNYVTVEMSKCVDLSIYEEQGFKIEKPKTFRTETTITNDKVIFEFNYPIKLSKQNQFIELSNFRSEINLRLGKILSKVKDFIEEIEGENRYNIFGDCSKYAFEDKLMNIYISDNLYAKEYLVTFSDAKPVADALPPLKFNFGVKNVILEGDCVG